MKYNASNPLIVIPVNSHEKCDLVTQSLYNRIFKKYLKNKVIMQTFAEQNKCLYLCNHAGKEYITSHPK
jgi:hypothetical protein